VSKKISLTINAKRYDIDIDEEFAPFLQKQMQEDFNIEGNNDLKLLLQAYVRKSYALYEDELKLQKLLKRLEISNS
jgi:hypothetical protein